MLGIRKDKIVEISEFRRSIMPNIILIYGPHFNTGKSRYYIELLFTDGTTIKIAYSRFVWEETNKQRIPKGMEIDHIDGNKLNNDPSNLQLLTPYENKLKSKGMTEFVLCVCPFTGKKHLIVESTIRDEIHRNSFKILCNPNLSIQENNIFKKEHSFTKKKWIKHIKTLNVYVLDTYQIYKNYKKTLSKKQLLTLKDFEIRELALKNINIKDIEHSNSISKRLFVDSIGLHKKQMFIEELGKYICLRIPLFYTWGKVIYQDRKLTDPFYIVAFDLTTDKNSLKEYIKNMGPLTEKDKQDLRNMFNYIDSIIDYYK